MTNPFEQLRNDKEKENNQELEKEIFGDTAKNSNINNDEDLLLEELESLSKQKKDNVPNLKLPPTINTYFIFTFFPIAIIAGLTIVIGRLFFPIFSYIVGGLIFGYILRFILQISFKKLLTEPYVEENLYPVMSEMYGDLFTKKDLIKMVSNTGKAIRKRFIGKNRLRTISVFEKDGVEYILLTALSKDNEVGHVLLADDEQVPTASEMFFQKQVRKLLINGFYGLWDSNIGVPAEFTSVSEEGVFNGTFILETEKQALDIVEKNSTLNEDDIVFLNTRGEKFRFLEMLSKVGLETTISMADGITFSAPPDALYEDFKNSSR